MGNSEGVSAEVYEVIYTRGREATLERYRCVADNASDAIQQWKEDTAGLKVCLLAVGRDDYEEARRSTGSTD